MVLAEKYYLIYNFMSVRGLYPGGGVFGYPATVGALHSSLNLRKLDVMHDKRLKLLKANISIVLMQSDSQEKLSSKLHSILLVEFPRSKHTNRKIAEKI